MEQRSGSPLDRPTGRKPDGSPVVRFLRVCVRRSVVRRAIAVMLVVGPILTLINQGDVIAARAFSPRFFLKLGLTFLVPYSVSTYSSAMAILAQTRGRADRSA
jgi:hypothetical protein